MLLHGPSVKVLISRFVERRADNEIAVFSLRDAEICCNNCGEVGLHTCNAPAPFKSNTISS